MTKWAFILRHETASRGGPAFYQFLPYKYGPFSFCLFQEMAALTRDGLVTDQDHRWALTASGRDAAMSALPEVRRDTRAIVRSHSKQSWPATDKHLIDYVYDKYPWYTLNSEIRRLVPRKRRDVAVYTAGYEGLLVDGFLACLMREGISRVVDVRNNPVSRRYGFHKSTLSRLCRGVGLDYVHFPQLGIQSSARQGLDKPGARQSLFADYRRSTLSRETAAIDEVAGLMGSAPSVLICVEACPDDCHRSHLAESLAARTRLPIHHLELCA